MKQDGTQWLLKLGGGYMGNHYTILFLCMLEIFNNKELKKKKPHNPEKEVFLILTSTYNDDPGQIISPV